MYVSPEHKSSVMLLKQNLTMWLYAGSSDPSKCLGTTSSFLNEYIPQNKVKTRRDIGKTRAENHQSRYLKYNEDQQICKQ